MANVDDVAAKILSDLGSMTAMKLEKLVYYSQAWHLVWESMPLFEDRIEAWANGPVIPSLYNQHRGQFQVDGWDNGDPKRLDESELTTIASVVSYYGLRSAYDLSELTHREAPWLDAREGMVPGERGNREITHAAMAEYYSSL